MALRPLFHFQQAQYVQVFPLKPAPFCTLFAGLGSTNESSTSLLFLSDFRCPRHPVLSSIFPFTSISLAETIFSLLLFYQAPMGPPDTRFSWGTTWLMSWPDGERYSCPVQSLVVCLVLSLVSTFSSIFSDWKRTALSKFFDTILPATSADTRPRTPLISFSALSSYELFALLALWLFSVSVPPFVQALGSCPTSGDPWSSAMSPSLGRGQVATTSKRFVQTLHQHLRIGT